MDFYCSDEPNLWKGYLKHSSARLQKIQKRHSEQYEHLKKETLVRISKSIFPSGNKLVLMTDLDEAINTKELANLYYQRWEIEKNTIH